MSSYASSYSISHSLNVQTVLQNAVLALWACLRTLLLLLLAGGLLAGTLALVAAFWLPIVQFAGALAIIAAFAWATYPRAKVRK